MNVGQTLALIGFLVVTVLLLFDKFGGTLRAMLPPPTAPPPPGPEPEPYYSPEPTEAENVEQLLRLRDQLLSQDDAEGAEKATQLITHIVTLSLKPKTRSPLQ